MPSFPLISELPKVVDTTGWTWKQFNAPAAPSDNFWLGTDRDGNHWLTKMRGASRAFREIVFAHLAQAMGWSCQSTVFMRIDKQSALTLGAKAGEINAAHWFLDEHPYQPCSTDCAISQLSKQDITLEVLMGSNIAHLLDWPKSEFATYLFGGHEPPGRLFTAEHEFVIIDSELMFSTSPGNFDDVDWLYEPDGSPSSKGCSLAIDVCRNFASLPEDTIEDALSVPKGFRNCNRKYISSILKKSRKFAANYCLSTNIPRKLK
jgi:hypothetical protein